MEDSVFIDCGGTPEYVLVRDKATYLLSKGIPTERIVILLDPFDLSRKMRTISLGNKKVKIKVNVTDVRKTASSVKVDYTQLKGKLPTQVYEYISKQDPENLRDLMNCVVSALAPPGVRITKTEDCLNKENIPPSTRVRVACAKCGVFSWVLYSGKTDCCKVPAEKCNEMVLEKGMLERLLELQNIRVFEDLTVKMNTMFESYLTRKGIMSTGGSKT